MIEKPYFDKFDEEKHMVCPKCGFEVIRLDAEKQTASYVLKNGEVDIDTIEKEDETIPNEEHGLIICNDLRCNWESKGA